jgi:DNA-binding MurR/RpiR family transcriptional regulator
MTTSLADIDARISQVSETLTPTERRIVSLLTEDKTAAAFLTVAELAERVESSGPTVVRFATKLGFAGYSDLQAAARQALADRINTPTERIRQKPSVDSLEAARLSVRSAIESTFSTVGADLLKALAKTVARSRGSVWIVASETSSPVAHILAANLRLIRPGVRHLGGSAAAVAAEVVEATNSDVVIAIDFDRYERAVVATTEQLKKSGATVVAVTDGPLSPIAALADQWVPVTIPAVGPFDSALPVLAIVEALTAEVATQLRDRAAVRLDRIEQSWLAYEVFETEPS